MGVKRVEVHIDRLMVDGLPAGERAAFVQALEERLRGVAMDAARQGMTESRRIAKVDAGVLRAGAGAEKAAEQVAESLRRPLMGGSSQVQAVAAGKTIAAQTPGEVKHG